jgi:hypothetical protein
LAWPIRTIYQSDEKREAGEIGRFDEKRNQLVKEHLSKETGNAEVED